jgi:glutamyl-tRNA synthetase
MIEAFSFSGVNRANAVFNIQLGDERNWTDPKALWMNGEYITHMPLDRLTPYVAEQLKKNGLWKSEYDGESAEWLAGIIDLLRPRYRAVTDFVTLGRPYFSDDYEFEEAAVKKNLANPALRELLPALADRYQQLEDFSLENTEHVLRALADEKGVKAGLLINGARTALTGQAVGPSMFHILFALGKDRTIARLKKGAQLVPAQAAS